MVAEEEIANQNKVKLDYEKLNKTQILKNCLKSCHTSTMSKFKTL